MKKFEDIESTLHVIIAGVLINGFIQGKEKEKLNTDVIKKALKEIKKLLTNSN